jgi:cytochrome c biogenesis protein CcmG/thiol:disulfide interchange protein DsbE
VTDPLKRRPAWVNPLVIVLIIIGGWWIMGLQAVQEWGLASSPPDLGVPSVPTDGVSRRVDVVISTLDAQHIDLSTATRPVVLNLFATWCPPCVAELPSLLRLQQAARNTADVYIVSTQEVDDVRAWAIGRGIDPANLATMSPSDVRGVLATQSIPMTWIIAPGGIVVQGVGGAHAWDDPSVLGYLKQFGGQ